MARMSGTIKRLVRDKGFGFIGADLVPNISIVPHVRATRSIGCERDNPSASTSAKGRKGRRERHKRGLIPLQG